MGVVFEFLLPVVALVAVLAAVDRYEGFGLIAYLTADRTRLGWFLAGTGVVVLWTAATYVAGSPPSWGGRYDGVHGFHVALLGFLVGVFLTVHGTRHYATATTIRDAVDITPSDLPVDGPVAVTGRVEPATHGTVRAPESGQPAVAAEAGRLVGDPSTTTPGSSGRAQQLIDAERRAVPFDVVDDYGSVRVEPDGASLAFVEGDIEGGTVERRVAPGDEVVVVGDADGGRLTKPVAVATAGNGNLGLFAANIPRVAAAGPVLAVASSLAMAAAAGLV